VNALESRVASELGLAAALFVPSGTQSNLIALLTHCQRGDEFIAGQQAHCYRYEGGGAAVLGGIQPQPLDFEADGSLDLDRVAAAIKPDDFHFARTRLLCLENTQAGRVLTPDYLHRAADFCRRHGLGLHLDGARLFNAAIACDCPVAELARGFDSVSVCLSKGLGAPVGSVLAGSEERIARARRWRKMLGGGMRQAGMLAAAGLHALDHHVDRLAHDHDRAARLAAALADLPLFSEPPRVATNMVFVTADPDRLRELSRHLTERGIRFDPGGRIVLHLDVDDADLDRVIDAVRAFRA
jgi:threonine aldolase